MNLVYKSNAVVEVTKEFTFDSARFIDNDIFITKLQRTNGKEKAEVFEIYNKENSYLVTNDGTTKVFGYVKDFLDFRLFNYNYPIFNLSDIAIFFGVILVIYAIIKGEDHEDISN